mgnify:FL=1
MSFEDAVEATAEIRGAYRPGLQVRLLAQEGVHLPVRRLKLE